MIKDTAVQILLEHFSEGMVRTIVDAIAKDEALEKKDEPVAWGMETDGLIYDVICPDEHEREEGEYNIPLYTTTKRTWVGLTDEDRYEFAAATYSWEELLIAAETKLKEKNT